ncbi:AfsR/SARP family transcriptional regulator [Micromonospora sp. DT233]|uniref:AfsR/SARP family transcriptional regulator n=1 Tax=Micromonospora sp. DT233 TaxID=3393432 RepID=UPI003CE872F5
MYEKGRSRVSAPKIEALFLALLVRSGEIVSSTQLIEEIWGDNPPRRASAALHVYISQLRKFLQYEVASPSVIVTRVPGYVLELNGSELDYHIFEGLVGEGRTQAREGHHEPSAAAFQAAVGMLPGGSLSRYGKGSISGSFHHYLDEMRLECLEALAKARLELGHQRQLIGWLRGLITEYPLHEPLYALLMQSMYRAGRRADALATYHTLRDTLGSELGLDPCRALYELHQEILLSETTLDTYAAA